MKKKGFIFGLIVSSIFIYLALKKVDYQTLKISLKSCNYFYIVPMAGLSVLLQFCKAYRWKLILEPVKKLSLSFIYYIHCIGFMGINILPFKLGEILRPYLLSKQGEIKLSTSLATTVVERMLDGGTLLLFMVIAVRYTPLPDWALKAGKSVFIVIALSITLLFISVLKGKSFLLKITSIKLLNPFQGKIIKIFESFRLGFDIMPNKLSVAFAVLLSVVFWIIPVINTRILFKAFSMNLSYEAALTLFIIVSIGMMIPSAPGFVGNFQFFCILALGLYGVDKSRALGFSIVLHAVQFFSIIAQGIFSLLMSGAKFNDIIKARNFMEKKTV